MAGIDRGTIRSYARLLAGDSGGTVTDAEVNAMIDETSEFVWNLSTPRYSIYTVAGTPSDAGLTLATPDWIMTSAALDWYEIAGIHYEGTDTDNTDGVIVERVDYGEWVALKQQDATSFVVADGPRRWAGVRQRKSAISSADGTAWNLYVHPGSGVSGATVSARVRRERAAYSGDSDVFDGTPVDTYAIARIVGWEIAARIGRGPSRLDWIAWLIPQNIRAAKGIRLHAEAGVESTEPE